jgi:hypothetical protein
MARRAAAKFFTSGIVRPTPGGQQPAKEPFRQLDISLEVLDGRRAAELRAAVGLSAVAQRLVVPLLLQCGGGGVDSGLGAATPRHRRRRRPGLRLLCPPPSARRSALRQRLAWLRPRIRRQNMSPPVSRSSAAAATASSDPTQRALADGSLGEAPAPDQLLATLTDVGGVEARRAAIERSDGAGRPTRALTPPRALTVEQRFYPGGAAKHAACRSAQGVDLCGVS